jgi:endonuclease/exonuclease/phosphatase family metal-dependent hydrolase
MRQQFSLCSYKMGAAETKISAVPRVTPTTETNSFTVVTYNTFLRPHIIQNDAQVARAMQMPAVLAAFQADVICLQECWSKFAVHHIVKQLQALGYTYIVKPRKIKKLKLLPAGLITCSKFPVVSAEFVPFTSCSGPDCLATKGFLYTHIAHPALGSVHVCNMHLQFVTASKLKSTDEKKRVVQNEQLQLWKAFMAEKRVNPKDIVLLAGDWNFDCLQNEAEFKMLLQELQVQLPELQGAQQVSVDPENNTLVGRGNEARKYGCVSVLYTGENCSCCPSRWVDFVVSSTVHRQPVASQCEIVPVKVAPFTTQWMQGCQDLSDHYPVVTTLQY